MCGEKDFRECLQIILAGSPPRVRGKEKNVLYKLQYRGITPACAGKRKREAILNIRD